MQKSAIGFKNFLFALIVFILILILDSKGYLQGPKNAALYLLSPVQSNFQSSSNIASDFFYTLSQIDSFKTDNGNLQEENRKLNFELSQLKEVKKENASLKEQLKFKKNLCGETDCISFKLGRIISRSPESYGEFIIIDIGSKEGARMNQAVSIAGGVIIGKITEIFDSHSKVMLLTSPESSVNCLTQTTRANGLAKGKYGTGVKLEMIDQSEELVPDDIVITSGLEAEIPKGLMVGKIQNIEESPNTVFKSADIRIFADLAHIEEIFLVESNAG